MNSAKLKETIANIVKEESDYQEFFRKALEKSGKSITDMSDEEKKAFFNKIDAAWDGRGEKNEGNAFGAAVTAAKEKGEDEFEVGGKTYKVESVNEGNKVFRVNPAIGKAKYSISSHDGVKKHKDGSDFFDIETFKNKVDLEKAIKNYTAKGFKMESVNEVKYPIAVAEFNKELIKHPMVKKAAQFYKKTPAEIVKAIQQRLYTKGDRNGNTKEVYIDFKDTTSGITIKHKMKFNESVESVNEGRAFINAAKKAKAEGKTEFEFNGKTYPVTIKESVVNEDANMNKKVKALLDKELRDLRKGGSNHYFAVMAILMGALIDANFHSEAKKVPTLFGSKAKYEGDPMAKQDLIRIYEDMGEKIASICKWDGKDIVNAVGFYVSMTIGRPMGQKIENLV